MITNPRPGDYTEVIIDKRFKNIIIYKNNFIFTTYLTTYHILNDSKHLSHFFSEDKVSVNILSIK